MGGKPTSDVVERRVYSHSVSVRVARGSWQLVTRYRLADESGRPIGASRTVTRMSGLPAGEPKSAAVEEAWGWRDSLVCEEAVRRAREAWEREASPDEALVGLERRLGIDEDALTMPFDDYAKDYIELATTRSGNARKHGAGGNSDILRLWILPFLPDAKRRVRERTGDDSTALVRNLESRGYAPATVAKAWTLFKSVLRYAVNVHGLRPDPTYGIHPKKVRKVRVNYLEVAKADQLAQRLVGMRQTAAVCAARLALAAGICAEESAGLTLGSCDPDRVQSIHITQVASRRDGYWAMRPPKVDERDRSIPMNDELKCIVRDRLGELSRQAASAGVTLGPDSYLLDNPGKTKSGWTTPDRLRVSWRAVADALGLVGVRGDLVTIHDLRHTFATAFLAKGGSVADLKAILGHSTPFMTLAVYAASDPTVRAQAMEMVGRELA